MPSPLPSSPPWSQSVSPSSLWRWIRPRRRFPPTREGWYFLIATLLIGLAAINAGVNLLFLVWGMMLFLILASGVMSELCLRQLEARRSPPVSVHAGATSLMGIALTNEKKRLPSFSVEVEDLVEGKPMDKRCYFLKLPAGRTQETAYRYVADRRGRLRLSGFRLSTRFPFGLIQKSRDVPAPAELLVYPALCPVPRSLLRGFASHHGRGEHKWRSRRGEFFGLRELRQGDDPRDIHWRTSARRGAPFIRETEDDEGQEVCLVIDNRPEDSAASLNPGAAALVRAEAAFEEMVSLAASLACELLNRGYRVGLAARGEQIKPEGGPAQATRLLRFLALVEPSASEVPLTDSGRTGATIHLRPGHAPRVGFGGATAAPRRIA